MRIKLFFIFLFASILGWGQTTIAGWTFPTTSGAANLIIPAECGNGNIYANGTNGSSSWTSFAGNDGYQYFSGNGTSELCGVTTSTGALAPTGNGNNGKSIVFKFSTVGFSDIKLSYDTRGTSSGFTTHNWQYSTDGITFTSISTITGRSSTTFSNQNIDFSSISSLNNNTNVYIKIVFSGATNNTGNNRLDNINFTGTSLPSGQTVTFKANGGTGTDYTQTEPEAANLIPNTFTRNGYTFTHWNTESDDSGTNYTDEEEYDFSADLDLYAQWEINQYTVSFDGNGNDAGTVPSSINNDYNFTFPLPNNTGGLTKSGYAFMGWNTNASGTGTHYNVGDPYSIPANNITLYAEWQSTLPSITTNGTISAMNTTYGTTSTIQNFNFNGVNLTGTEITVTAPSGFEVATTSGGAYSNSITYAISSGSSSGTVYVRLAATTPVGTYNGNITLNDGSTSTTIAIPNSTVTPKELTITGLTPSGNNKVYNGTTMATVGGTATLSGVISGDNVVLGGTPTFTYNNKNVANNKPITVSGYTISGIDAGNYSLTQPTGISGNITAATLTVTGATAQDKVWDGNATATITGATLVGIISPDVVTVSGGGNFEQINAGTNINVTANLNLGGADAGNYILTQPTGLTANITKANLTFTTSTINISVGDTYILPGANITSPSDGVFSYSITGGGNATYNGVNTLNGVTVGTETLTINQAEGTNHFAGSTTVTVNVVTQVYTNGDYRTTGSGTWVSNSSSPAIWQRYNATTDTWNNSNSPVYSSTNSIYIRNGHNITTGGSFGSGIKIHILEGGTFNAMHQGTTSSINVYSGGVLNISASFTNTGDFQIEDNGVVNLNGGLNNYSSLWSGNEIFSEESYFYINYANKDQLLFEENTISLNPSSNSLFGNLIIQPESFNGTSGNWTGIFPNGSYKLTAKDLIIKNNTPRNFTLNGGDFTIGRNFVVNVLSTGDIATKSTTGTQTITVLGNFEKYGAGGGRFRTNGSGIFSLNIDGDLNINEGIFSNLGAGSSSVFSTINLKGNFNLGASATLISNNTNSTIVPNAKLKFVGNGNIQTINAINQNTILHNTLIVDNNAFVQIINQNLSIGTYTKLIVENGGSLDFGFNGSIPLILKNSGSLINTSFESKTGSKLFITSPQGIQSSGLTGNVQTNTRTFENNGNFEYVGLENQSTGNALPTSVRDIIINNPNEVTLNNASLSVIGIMDIQQGIFNLNDKNVAGSGGNANMNIETPGTIKIVGTKNFPIGFNPIIFKNSSTVEYGGITQTVAVTGMTNYSNLPAYENLVISGSEIKSAGDKNLVVNQITKVNSSTLRIPETAEDEEPYVLTAKNGIDVASTATLLLENNANLMQDPGVVNTGNIHLKRKAVVPKIQYNFWSSPVIQQVLYQLYPGIPNNKVMVYNTATDFFKVLTYSSNPKSEFGKGYSIKGSALDEHQPNVEATFIGTPNNQSSISGPDLIPLSIAKQQYNLIGNPYPSNLDLVSVYNHPDNEEVFNQDEPSAYFWDNTDNTDLNQQGEDYVNQNYAILNLPSGVGTSAPRLEESEGKRPNGIVRPGQGFIVRANPGHENPQIKLYNTMRTTSITSGGSISTYFKGSQPSFEDTYENTDLDTAEPNYFYLGMSTPNDLHMEIAIGYFDGANLAKEKFDSEIMNESASDNFYSFSSDNFKLGIQGRPAPFDAKDIIQLGSKHYQPGRYTIYLKDRYGLFRNQKIYIKDRKANTIHDLTVAPFTFFTEHSELSDRYQIIFKTSTKVKASENPQLTNKVEISKKDANIVVESTIDKIVEIELVNLSGTTIYKNSSINKNEWKISENKFNKQIVVVKVITEKGDIVTKKLINQ